MVSLKRNLFLEISPKKPYGNLVFGKFEHLPSSVDSRFCRCWRRSKKSSTLFWFFSKSWNWRVFEKFIFLHFSKKTSFYVIAANSIQSRNCQKVFWNFFLKFQTFLRKKFHFLLWTIFEQCNLNMHILRIIYDNTQNRFYHKNN